MLEWDKSSAHTIRVRDRVPNHSRLRFPTIFPTNFPTVPDRFREHTPDRLTDHTSGRFPDRFPPPMFAADFPTRSPIRPVPSRQQIVFSHAVPSIK